jgi:hypothetical protein
MPTGIRWKNWDPEGVKQDVARQLAANGEIVGKFVEEDARRRLMAIKDPEWGQNYRQKLVARLLTNVVEQERNAVVIMVGVRVSSSRSGKASRRHGFYIELGSKTAPAHPFLRPAVFENKRKIVGLLTGR